jgi:hypothetical protein
MERRLNPPDFVSRIHAGCGVFSVGIHSHANSAEPTKIQDGFCYFHCPAVLIEKTFSRRSPLGCQEDTPTAWNLALSDYKVQYLRSRKRFRMLLACFEVEKDALNS